jgi:hypothetical protein
LSVDDRGGFCLRSGEQRFYEGLIGFTFPMAFSGVADVCEWFEDSHQRFHIEVNVHNEVWGGYSDTGVRLQQSGRPRHTMTLEAALAECDFSSTPGFLFTEWNWRGRAARGDWLWQR